MSAVFILMVIIHLSIVMYNKMPDNFIPLRNNTSNETNAGNSMGKLCFFDVCFKNRFI